MLRETTCRIWLAAAAAISGCGTASIRDVPQAPYRTVAAEPGRDTEAARRANQVGLAHLAKGEVDQAAEAFRQALTADVEFGPAHNNLGKVYYRQTDWYRAAWEFEYASKLLPRHAEPRNNLALVLERAGQLDRAVECYREAAGLDPDNIQYRANLVRALIRRGDRTDEVRTLLGQLLETDARPEWRAWARQQQIRIGGGSGPAERGTG